MTVAELEMRRRELQVQQQALDEVHADDPDFKAGGRKAEDAVKRVCGVGIEGACG